MEDLIEDLTRGNVTEVKVVLASVVLGLAVYQILLAAVAYGWIRLRILERGSAAWTHRASGDTILVLTVVIAIMCIGYSGFEDGGAHSVVATILLGVFATKVLVVRFGGRLSRVLPLLGVSLLILFGITWLTSAGDFLGVG